VFSNLLKFFVILSIYFNIATINYEFMEIQCVQTLAMMKIVLFWNICVCVVI